MVQLAYYLFWPQCPIYCCLFIGEKISPSLLFNTISRNCMMVLFLELILVI